MVGGMFVRPIHGDTHGLAVIGVELFLFHSNGVGVFSPAGEHLRNISARPDTNIAGEHLLYWQGYVGCGMQGSLYTLERYSTTTEEDDVYRWAVNEVAPDTGAILQSFDLVAEEDEHGDTPKVLYMRALGSNRLLVLGAVKVDKSPWIQVLDV